jgi:hypothetical protein
MRAILQRGGVRANGGDTTTLGEAQSPLRSAREGARQLIEGRAPQVRLEPTTLRLRDEAPRLRDEAPQGLGRAGLESSFWGAPPHPVSRGLPKPHATFRGDRAPVIAGASSLAIYAACLFCFAHRALCASAIRLRPAAETVRFFTSIGFGLLVDPGGLPRLRGLSVPARRVRACCRRAISSSMLRSRSVIFICLFFVSGLDYYIHSLRCRNGS